MQRVEPLDWLGLAALTVMFGSAFMLIKLAVQEFPPAIVTAARIEIAAVILLAFALIRKESFSFLRSTWPLIIALAIFGNCLPFYLISWGQQTVDSGIAGVLMAVMPLTTIVLAHFFVPGEKLNVLQVLGFLSGFAGVLVLLGPAAIAELGGSAHVFFPMLAVLGGALCYAVNSILAKRLPGESLFAMSASVLTVASLIMLPAWFVAEGDWTFRVTSIEFLSVVLLGTFPTALATLIYFAVIARAGPSFLSQINYLIPVLAVFMGTAFLGEPFSIRASFALVIILASIAVAGRGNPSVTKL
ncbi:MAG: DMT family transporter [Gammaproteobacteria bacterium]|nr:DMT family transporter [Gammaproteobacteria bacterium]